MSLSEGKNQLLGIPDAFVIEWIELS